MLGLEELSRADRRVVNRARRLERFLTQPFFTTEQFTGQSGRVVPLEEALDGCERILDDEFADYPERALYMIGSVDEARRRRNDNASKILLPNRHPGRIRGDQSDRRGGERIVLPAAAITSTWWLRSCPGCFRSRPQTERKFAAIGEGVLVKRDGEVLVSALNGVRGADLGLLRLIVREELRGAGRP